MEFYFFFQYSKKSFDGFTLRGGRTQSLRGGTITTPMDYYPFIVTFHGVDLLQNKYFIPSRSFKSGVVEKNTLITIPFREKFLNR